MASEHRNYESANKMYATKWIQFSGRRTPIILQDHNSLCPLRALCNVLLLKNNLRLSTETGEVSREELLTLVVELLMDSNSVVNIKDSVHGENQQQNIDYAIHVLRQLAIGVDIIIKFQRIQDIEFTPECALFDLLDIPLRHGWIVDPQDHDTANAIGEESYNACTGKSATLETHYKKLRRGNIVENDELSRTLKLSEVYNSFLKGLSGDGIQNFNHPEPPLLADCSTSSILNKASFETISFEEVPVSSIINEQNQIDQPNSDDLADMLLTTGLDNTSSYKLVKNDCEYEDVSQAATDDSLIKNENERDSTFTIENDGTVSEVNELGLAQSTPSPDADVDSFSGRSNHELNQADTGTLRAHDSDEKSELIRNFLEINKSQLSVNGLFCLHEGLKEQELCVFFRNNHFRTMFKYNGELYLLVTNEDYIYHSEIVWEKLDSVDGNIRFVNSHFEEFKQGICDNDTWGEYNASDYLATIDNSANPDADLISDREPAIALQPQEFEQLPPRQNLLQSSTSSSSRLATVPQVSRTNPLPLLTKQDEKPKEKKCSIL